MIADARTAKEVRKIVCFNAKKIILSDVQLPMREVDTYLICSTFTLPLS